MRPVSADFLAALTGSHNMAVRLRAVPAGQTGVSPTGGVTLDLVSGNVQLDGTADIRSTIECEVTAVDPATGDLLWPAGATAALAPYGQTELYAERGIAFGGGSIEYVSLGYFRINDVEQDDVPAGSIRLSGVDRMANILDAKLTDPVQFSATDTYGDVVSELVLDAYADAVIEWDDTDIQGDAIGRTAVAESDRFAFIAELVTGVGKVAYFDHRGVLLVRTAPDPRFPLWTVSRGRSGVLVRAARSISRQGVYNGVIATGEAFDTDVPARGLAVDSSPISPTRWGGPFGKVPREFSSPLLTTDEQARLAATTVLRRSLGLPYNVQFSAVPNAALEPYDPVMIGIEGEPVAVAPEVIVGDSFTRTVVNGIGTSDSGHAWDVLAGANANCQVTGGVFERTVPNPNGSAANVLPTAAGRRNVDLYCNVQVPNAATGASLVAGLVLRYADANNYYAARMEFDTDGKISTKLHGVFDGVFAQLLSIPGIEPAYSAAQWWTMRARAEDDLIQFKAWPTAETEPRDWWWTYEEAIGPGAAERFGLWVWRVNGNTNAVGPHWKFDNYRALTVPETTLRGGEIHVIDSLTVPLTAAEAMTGTTREQTLTVIETS